jgi:hypothetical protein
MDHDVVPCVATCPTAPDLTSILRWAPALPHVLQLWTLAPRRGALRRCHASRNSGPHHPTVAGSVVATWPVAPDLASPLRRAPMLPCVPRYRTPPPCGGGFQHCHTSRGFLWAAGLKCKERLNWPRYVVRFACSQGAVACFKGTCA